MNKKYCVTSFSTLELRKASELYGNFSFSSISDFYKNESVYESMEDSRIDVVYVFSKLLQEEWEFWGILSGSLFVTEDWVFWINEKWELQRILENSTIYILRTGDMPKSFIAFLSKFAKKRWGIEVVSNFDIPADMPLSSKCHALAYLDTDHFPTSVIPYISSETDFEYLSRFLRESGKFSDSIIAKKSGFSSGDGVRIFSLNDDRFWEKLKEFLKDCRTQDYVIMQLLETEDIEYRAYWAKRNGENPEILEVHGKVRINGHVLHNIAKWNMLQKLNKSILPKKIQEDILSYCWNLPEPHGGLDILLDKDGKYYFTENNIMTGYLSEPEEQYFAKGWLDAVASYYNNSHQ